MVLKRNFLFIILIALTMSACCCTKDIDEKYLSKIEVIDISTKDKKTIKITGSYGESAWGISSLFAKKEGNNIIITGKLKLKSKEEIDLILDIPNDVNNVFFYSQKIWSR